MRGKWNEAEDWEVVRQFLPVGWEAAARECGALRRARELRDAETLLRTLLLHVGEGCSLQETSVRVRMAKWARVSSVALFKRLQGAEQWLRWLAERLWRQEAGEESATPAGWRLRAVDATTVRETGRTGSLWRVHYALDLWTLQCAHFEVTDVRGGETFRRIPVSSGDLLLGDRAYGTPPGISHVVGRGGGVIVRINLKMLPLHTASGRRLGILARLRRLRVGEIGEWPAMVQGPKGVIAGRLIAIRRSRQAAALARRRAERTARRKQRPLSDAALDAAGYVFIWTSLPAEQLSASMALELYRLRWQIELAFKRLKSLLGLGQLPKRDQLSARAWLHGKLFVAFLLERMLEDSTGFSPWGYPLAVAPQPLARGTLPQARTAPRH